MAASKSPRVIGSGSRCGRSHSQLTLLADAPVLPCRHAPAAPAATEMPSSLLLLQKLAGVTPPLVSRSTAICRVRVRARRYYHPVITHHFPHRVEGLAECADAFKDTAAHSKATHSSITRSFS